MNSPIFPIRPFGDSRPVPPPDPRAQHEHAAEVEVEPDPWAGLLRGAEALLRPGARQRGVELRHVRRLVQPIVDAAWSGDRVISALTGIAPGESPAAHAAHTAVAAVCVSARLGLGRAAAADIGVASLWHDAGHGAPGGSATLHTMEGARQALASTSWSPLSLHVVQVAIAHHAEWGAPLAAQVVAAADSYVTLLSFEARPEPWLSPSGALARVIGGLCERWHPAIAPALVRALGLYPPGQVVQMDDGSYARALAPDAHDPARPWIARLVDARGLPVPAWASEATPLPPRRHVVRALPRPEWRDIEERPAA
jgi:hypothetical protein